MFCNKKFRKITLALGPKVAIMCTKVVSMTLMASETNNNYKWNPWKVDQVHPSDIIVNKFQTWDKTQNSRLRLKAWNRAKKWVSDLIRLDYDPWFEDGGQG